jgi:hypothetical protein
MPEAGSRQRCPRRFARTSLEPAALNLLDLKAFQDRIDARHPDRQTAEIQIRVARITRFKALGTAEIIRVA